MKTFDAKEARAMAPSVVDTKFQEVIEDIKKEAKEGKTYLYVYESLSEKTQEKLTNLGFTFTHYGNVTIQKDNLYYKIEW